MFVWPACWSPPAPVGPPGRFWLARTLARRNFRSDPILRILILVLIFVILAGQMAPWRRAGARPPPWGCLVPWAPGGGVPAARVGALPPVKLPLLRRADLGRIRRIWAELSG